MMSATTTSTLLGYARVATGNQSLDQQVDALPAAGVARGRIHEDKLSGTSSRERRPGLNALLDYARPGDAIVVVGIDQLGRHWRCRCPPAVTAHDVALTQLPDRGHYFGVVAGPQRRLLYGQPGPVVPAAQSGSGLRLPVGECRGAARQFGLAAELDTDHAGRPPAPPRLRSGKFP